MQRADPVEMFGLATDETEAMRAEIPAECRPTNDPRFIEVMSTNIQRAVVTRGNRRAPAVLGTAGYSLSC